MMMKMVMMMTMFFLGRVLREFHFQMKLLGVELFIFPLSLGKGGGWSAAIRHQLLHHRPGRKLVTHGGGGGG